MRIILLSSFRNNRADVISSFILTSLETSSFNLSLYSYRKTFLFLQPKGQYQQSVHDLLLIVAPGLEQL